jgi:phenylacetate-CoA ligase
MSAAADRRRDEGLSPAELEQLQLSKLNDLLVVLRRDNPFYAGKLRGAPQRLESLDQLDELPLTSKDELAKAEPLSLRSFPPANYVRFHQTSGTHGRPLPILDTAADWQWWIDCWQFVLDAAGVTTDDRAMLAFSFGPFIGFWSAHDALVARGALAIPSGGMSTLARLELLERTAATVLCCTPSYALRLAEVAAEHKISLRHFAVRTIIVAGEPGGSQPSVRQRIEEAWEAKVIDHAGATEVGAWGYADVGRRGLHIIESEFIAEFRSIETGAPAHDGELSHLILTPLGRRGMPVLRYRTGDVVRPVWPQEGPNRFVLLEGGVVSRADDMLIIRGVNVFPSAVDQILRSFPEVVEYRATACKRGTMDELVVEVEDHLAAPRRIAEEFVLRLGLQVEVRLAEPKSLPRFEGKGRRFIDART